MAQERDENQTWRWCMFPGNFKGHFHLKPGVTKVSVPYVPFYDHHNGQHKTEFCGEEGFERGGGRKTPINPLPSQVCPDWSPCSAFTSGAAALPSKLLFADHPESKEVWTKDH